MFRPKSHARAGSYISNPPKRLWKAAGSQYNNRRTSALLPENNAGRLDIVRRSFYENTKRIENLVLVRVCLESLNSADWEKSLPYSLAYRPESRQGMTMSEKIFAMHDVDRKGFVVPGETIRARVD
jgi:hypothetical protein